MKRNSFGDLVLQPGDDAFAAFRENFPDLDDGLDGGEELHLTARFVEFDDVCAWGCTLSDDSGAHELEVHDFADKEALVNWLSLQQIIIDT